MKQFVALAKLKKGDQVAILSPSAGLPGIFPWVYELGLERLKNNFGLVPKEYPTTRQMGSSLEDRAKDIMAAFADPANKAIFTSIGGSDQIKLIKLLDKQVFIDNPKPIFGFSDNTHLELFLWNLGIPSYYGGAIMTQFAMQQQMHDLTVEFLNHALFDTGEFEARVSSEYNDIGLQWADKETLAQSRQMEPNVGLFWDGSGGAEGRLWGGCAESLSSEIKLNKYLPKAEDLENTILFLETSEEMPEHIVIEDVINTFGQRGWFNKFQAVLVGRPKAWHFDRPHTREEKDKYAKDQRDTVIETVRKFNKQIPVVQNLDFGHTDPQIVLPMGGKARVDSDFKKIFLTY